MSKVVYLLVVLVSNGPHPVAYYGELSYCEDAKKGFPEGWRKNLACIPVDGSLDQRTGQ